MKPIKANIATVKYIDKRIVYSILAAMAIVSLLFVSRNIYSGFRYHADILNCKEKIIRLQETMEAEACQNDEIKISLNDKEQEKIEKEAFFVNRLIALDIFPWNNLLDILEKSVPEGMILNSIVPSDNFKKIKIDGYAGSMQNITHLLKMLDTSKMFSKSSLLQLGVDESDEASTQGKTDIYFAIESFGSGADFDHILKL